MAAISIKTVNKRHRDGTVAVRGFNLDIADGELMTLGDRLAVMRDRVLQQVGTSRLHLFDPDSGERLAG
jgi:ABC-type sugar transport system ATPase subunit